MRDEISSYRFNISEGSKEFEVVQSIFDGLTKNGNAENFYSKYYATVALHAPTSLSPVNNDAMSKSLQEKEITGLQYLGGYVLQNLHKKHRASKNWKSTESQQAMSLLTACKEESSNK